MVVPLYTGLEARVESRSANHRPSRLGHEGAHDGLWLDGNWASDTFFFCHGQKRDYLSRASQCARDATKSHKNSVTKKQKLHTWERHDDIFNNMKPKTATSMQLMPHTHTVVYVLNKKNQLKFYI